MLAQTALFILLLFSLIEEKSLEADYQCVGIRREDRSYDFKLPPDVDENVQMDGCDAEWTVGNGTFIADSTIDGKKSGPFVAVTPENLTVSTCANLQWQLHCDNIQFHCIINYTVKHQGTRDFLPGNGTISEDKEDANSPNWLTAVIVASAIVSVAILSVTIWIFWGKNIYERFSQVHVTI